MSALFEAAGARHSIAVGGPQAQRLLQTFQNRLLLSACPGMVDDHVIGVMAMACLHHLVRADQVHRVRLQTVMPNQRMLLDDRLDLLSGFWLGGFIQLPAVLDAPFDEDSQDGRPNNPLVMV